MKRKMDPVVHFEMPYEDRQRVSAFYSSAFGWQSQMTGEEMGNYVAATTTESEEHEGTPGLPKKPGAINGGLYPKREDWPARYPSVVIKVGTSSLL